MNHKFIIPFIDISLLLVIMLVFMVQNDMNQGKSANRKVIPAVFVFIEKIGNNYQARCNGHKNLSPQQVINIACQDKSRRQVIIIASIEGDTPYRFWSKYKIAINLYNLDLDRTHKNGPHLKWDTQLLGN